MDKIYHQLITIALKPRCCVSIWGANSQKKKPDTEVCEGPIFRSSSELQRWMIVRPENDGARWARQMPRARTEHENGHRARATDTRRQGAAQSYMELRAHAFSLLCKQIPTKDERRKNGNPPSRNPFCYKCSVPCTSARARKRH